MSPDSAVDVLGLEFRIKMAGRNSGALSRVLPGYSSMYSPEIYLSQEPRIRFYTMVGKNQIESKLKKFCAIVNVKHV